MTLWLFAMEIQQYKMNEQNEDRRSSKMQIQHMEDCTVIWTAQTSAESTQYTHST